MGLLDEARVASRVTRAECGVAVALKQLDKKTGGELSAALADVSITSKALHVVLDKRGIQCAAQSIQRHRRGDCQCPR